jgi:2,3-diketo-5-methylthio-1-phosphopentane phosphatase
MPGYVTASKVLSAQPHRLRNLSTSRKIGNLHSITQHFTMTISLPALQTNPKVILFSDWDGTITLQDSNDYITDDLGMGREKRTAINDDILFGRTSFRDGFRKMLESIDSTFPECVDFLVQRVQLDPGFKDFYFWARENNVPVVIVSSGMKPIIKALLAKLIGEKAVEETEIISNDVKINGDNTWEIIYRDESSFGHDKSRAIRPYAEQHERPILLYAGDGVSDLSAARETDLLFAKAGRDLIRYCDDEKIPYTVFHSYADIHKEIKDIVEGKATVKELAGKVNKSA